MKMLIIIIQKYVHLSSSLTSHLSQMNDTLFVYWFTIYFIPEYCLFNGISILDKPTDLKNRFIFIIDIHIFYECICTWKKCLEKIICSN